MHSTAEKKKGFNCYWKETRFNIWHFLFIIFQN